MMKNKTAAVLPCRGIGDALLMMIASEAIRKNGVPVTTVHPRLPELREWFPGHSLARSYQFADSDWIVAENDNSEKIRCLKNSYPHRLSVFYPTYHFPKHGILGPADRLFDPRKPMAENIAAAIGSLLEMPGVSKDNGIVPPAGLSHRHHRHRVVIHPSSSSKHKNWLTEKYEEVARGLEKRGFEPVFAPNFPSLGELAAFVYESGFVIGNDSLLGHLASNLHIPSLVVADKSERMELWRPGWLQGRVITLSHWVPKWRFFEKNWQYFISSARVLRAFDDLASLY